MDALDAGAAVALAQVFVIALWVAGLYAVSRIVGWLLGWNGDSDEDSDV